MPKFLVEGHYQEAFTEVVDAKDEDAAVEEVLKDYRYSSGVLVTGVYPIGQAPALVLPEAGR